VDQAEKVVSADRLDIGAVFTSRLYNLAITQRSQTIQNPVIICTSGQQFSAHIQRKESKVDRLELALRRYQQIVPKPVDHAGMPLRALNIWLSEDVNAVLDDYTRRPSFREHASWPVRALSVGANSSERDLIDQIDSEIVRCGRALLKLADKRLIKRKTVENVPAKPVVVGETVRIDDAGSRVVAREYGQPVELEMELSQIDAIAQRDWDDLVNVNDYFEPQQQWSRDFDDQAIQHADAIVSINPELLPIGNFIVRRVLARIETRLTTLESFRRRCLTALQQVRSAYSKDCTEIESAWSELSRLHAELVRSFRSGTESRLRDACVVSTQIYAAFSPGPNVTWLGLDADIVNDALPALRARGRGWDNAHMFERIAASLGSLRQLYGDTGPDRSAIEEAIAAGGLVIDELRHEAFWQTERLDKQPTKSAWILLVALARKAQRRMATEERDVWGDEAVSLSAMSTAWGRLKNCLPSSLWRQVQPGEERATYRLSLDAHRIHIFS
jgi:hypothetical protein